MNICNVLCQYKPMPLLIPGLSRTYNKLHLFRINRNTAGALVGWHRGPLPNGDVCGDGGLDWRGINQNVYLSRGCKVLKDLTIWVHFPNRSNVKLPVTKNLYVSKEKKVPFSSKMTLTRR